MVNLKNLANTLTLARIVLIPFILITFFINSPTPRLIAACLFVLACITDYLDGFIARTFDQETRFGEILDPIADKLLIASTLLMLVGFDRISKFSILAAVIILCREILVSGLREYLAEVKILLSVSFLAKVKTTVQMSALAVLLYTDPEHNSVMFQVIGELLLWIAAGITLYSGWIYVQVSLGTVSENSSS
jgi:cardiolipin synthase (CMP-forming)